MFFFSVLSDFSCFLIFFLYYLVFPLVSCFSSITRFFVSYFSCIIGYFHVVSCFPSITRFFVSYFPVSSDISSCIMFFQYYKVFCFIFSCVIRYFQLYHVFPVLQGFLFHISVCHQVFPVVSCFSSITTYRSAIRSCWARFAILAVFTLIKTERNINHWANHGIIL